MIAFQPLVCTILTSSAIRDVADVRDLFRLVHNMLISARRCKAAPDAVQCAWPCCQRHLHVLKSKLWTRICDWPFIVMQAVRLATYAPRFPALELAKWAMLPQAEGKLAHPCF